MKKPLDQLKIAIVHEWFVNHAGSEKVVEELLKVFPDARLFSLVDFLRPDQRAYLGGRKIRTSFIQHLPFSRRHFRSYFPLFPLAVEGHDLREFDLIISSSHMVSKGLLCRQDQLHISYVHSPCRFAWDLYHQYLEEAGLRNGLKGYIAQYFLHRLRSWDIISLHRVRHFVANSAYIGNRIRHVYNRDSEVVFPPADTERFVCTPKKGDYFFAAGRAVPYKKLDVIAQAFAAMPDKRLVLCISGDRQINHAAAPNVEIRQNCPDSEFTSLMAGAKALVFAAEEDFGITMAEALACGTPVIAFSKGGATEIVREGFSGMFFEQQTAEFIISAVQRFENEGLEWTAEEISASAERFSRKQFREQIYNLVERKWAEF
jgi:glycosyltransferase involved in cell wall biosynthesis